MLKFTGFKRQEINLVFKIKVFVGSKIWYFNKFHLFLFSKNLGCYSRLLTHRAGGKHGDEEDLQWRFPSPVGCQEELLDTPDLGSTTAADRDVFLEN
jgi:hypothetical protein